MIAVVFPGQGSQRPGMGQNLHGHSSAAREVWDRVSEAVGQSMTALCWDSTEEELRQTQNAQLALYTAGLAAFAALHAESGLHPDGFAGHSIGEYAALAAAGVFSIETGARLVHERGRLMASAGSTRPGAMAAVIGLTAEEIRPHLAEVADQGVCVIANDNCPGQLVISGDVNAVHAASALLPDRGAKRVLTLNVSGAFHSPLMVESADQMAIALGQAEFRDGQRVYSNVTAQVGSDWPKLLEDQLKSPVRWTELVQTMVADGFDTYVECGCGEVLSGLIRRIEKSAKIYKVVDPATLEETVGALNGGNG